MPSYPLTEEKNMRQTAGLWCLIDDEAPAGTQFRHTIIDGTIWDDPNRVIALIDKLNQIWVDKIKKQPGVKPKAFKDFTSDERTE